MVPTIVSSEKKFPSSSRIMRSSLRCWRCFQRRSVVSHLMRWRFPVASSDVVTFVMRSEARATWVVAM
eukprot:1661866-Prorocentrum_lima.AAC.1